MYKWLVITLSFCLSLVYTLSSEASCQNVNHDGINDGDSYGLMALKLDDPKRQYSYEDVVKLPESEFSKINSVITSSYKGGGVWLRVCLRSGASNSQDYVISVLPSYIERVTLYEPYLNGFHVREQGAIYPWSNRDIEYRGFTFPVKIDAKEEQYYWLNLQFFNRVSADISIVPEGDFYSIVADDSMIFGLYCGVVFIVVFINFLFFVWFRESAYVYYASCALVLGLFTSLTGGYLTKYLYPEGGYSSLSMVMVLIALFFAFFHLFLLRSYDLKVNYPVVSVVVRISSFFCFVFSLLFYLYPDLWVYKFFSYVYYVSIASILFVIFYDIFVAKMHRLYSYSLLPLQISFIVNTARSMGYGSWIPFADELPGVASLVHLITINVALVRRAWKAEKDKTEMANNLLVQSKLFSRSLERKVEERTSALKLLNENLKEEIDLRRLSENRLKETLLTEQGVLKAKREFIALFSHEIKSPIALIDLSAQNIEVLVEGERSDILRRLENIRSGVKRVNAVIQNCIINDKLHDRDGDTGQLDFRVHDFPSFIRTVIKDTDSTGRVVVKSEMSECQASFDYSLMALAFGNIVDNALKYSDSSLEVNVQLTFDGPDVIVRVTDFGDSIPNNERENIFKKYYRTGRVHGQPGSGLGLFLAKIIVDRHGGTLTILDVTEQRGGNTFEIRLPQHGPNRR